MSRIDKEYDVICNGRVIATFEPGHFCEPWAMRKGMLLKLESEEHGEQVFQVEKCVYPWAHPPGFIIEGLPPDRPDPDRGKLHVRPYLRNYEHGIA